MSVKPPVTPSGAFVAGIRVGLDLPSRKAIEDAAIASLAQIAAKENGKQPQELVVRDIWPTTDLAFNSGSNDIWDLAVPASAGFASTAVINATALANDTFLGIYGVANTAKPTAIHQIKFQTGSAVIRDIWGIRQIYAYMDEVGFGPFLVWKRVETVTINYNTDDTTSGTIRLVLLGKTCEPVSKKINPLGPRN